MSDAIPSSGSGSIDAGSNGLREGEPGTLRILIVQTAFLGDVVLTLPLIAAIRQRFPQACVEILTRPDTASILQGQAGVHAVMAYDKRGAQRGIRGFLSTVRRIRARRYDLVLAPHRSVRSALLLACSGIPRRVGFAGRLTRWAYTTTVPRPVGVHKVAQNHHLLTALGLPPFPQPRQFTLQVSPLARQRVMEYFAGCDIGPEEVVIGMIPGSQWGTKRWPAERFATLIEQVAAWQPAHFVLFGGPQDRTIAAAITTACHIPVLDLVGQTSLRDLPAYMERCALVVSNDTGPMHIAAALGKPVLALYGPTTTALGFTPYGVPWKEVSVALPCRPCNSHGPQRCPLSHWRCMLDLSVEQVAAGVQRLLRNATSPARGEQA